METKATLDRFEDDKAVLITKDKEIIIIPKKLLPENAREGESLGVNIFNQQKNTEKNRELAKEILNEILNV